MRGYNQWVNWRIDDGRKVPIDPKTGRYASVSDPSTWASYEVAASTGGNIGYILTKNDPYFFVDIDKCANPDGTWSPIAVELCGMFQGAYIEVSQSGRGIHIIGTGARAPHACKNIALGIELYTEGRMISFTGFHASGDISTNCDTALSSVIQRYFPPSASAGTAEWTDAPCPESRPIKSDAKLIERACKSRGAAAAFGGSCSFADLWYANTEALSAAYPDPSGDRDYDASSADAALAQHLAFWTGKDCERIKNLMRQSSLVRDKWEREDYLYRTILTACARQTTVYTKGAEAFDPATVTAPIGVSVVGGYQLLTVEAQLEYFKGCVYIQELHRVFTPTGAILNSERFNATYSGYVFQLDAINDKITKKPWEAFVDSQAIRWPKADVTCFRPDLPSGAIIEEDGRKLVNIYTPVDTRRVQGDISPFINHLKKILPDPRDQQIILAYMAACIQHKGVKFQWTPLIQGTEGNGKTLLTRCIAYAVGDRYTHMAMPNEIGEKFNEWLFNRIFIGIEDVYVPENKREVIEILKPMITNDRLAMRAMQQSQVMGDNRANFFLNSNHKDAIRKTHSDRRFAVFFSAQQTKEDLVRDGMDGDYFPRLYDWLKYKDGYAIVNDFLHTYAIPDELNPATLCHRAPETSTTEEAIALGAGGIEQEIAEAIAEGRPGFAGGWISSIALNNLLDSLRAGRILPPNKRKKVLEDMGYIHHPALTDGRVNNPLAIDGNRRPRLFVKKGHPASMLQTHQKVVEHYIQAQGLAVNAATHEMFGGSHG